MAEGRERGEVDAKVPGVAPFEAPAVAYAEHGSLGNHSACCALLYGLNGADEGLVASCYSRGHSDVQGCHGAVLIDEPLGVGLLPRH